MEDVDGYRKAQQAMECAETAIMMLEAIGQFLGIARASGQPVGGMIDAVSDAICAIQINRMDLEVECDDYRDIRSCLVPL